jgi:3-oxoadipate enol-lactonase
MPHLSINGVRLYYEEQGSGAETIVLSHGLLWSGRMFDAQVRALRDRYRCITFDHRGHGRSEITRGGYDMDTLTWDAATLIETLGAGPCHFVGLSMGGFAGMRLALRRPDLLRSLTLIETSADPEPPENAPRYRMLGMVARWVSMRLVADRVMPIMFGRKFLEDPAREAERREWRERLIGNDRVGIQRALRGVIERQGVHDQIDRITVPTLVMVGDQDMATPAAKAERIAGRIPGARLVTIPGAGHTSTAEEPEAVNAELVSFLSDPAGYLRSDPAVSAAEHP